MTLRISKAAETELDDAMAFYRLQRSGLEMEFLAELEAAFKRIADYPLAWHPCRAVHAAAASTAFHTA
jgi:plasmid stabilization system protein ParE